MFSVAIITKNEEERLPACLRSVSFADDIVVVDSGSTDKTVKIATEFGCRVFVEEWKGDGPQKNSAVEKCKHDWVLIIDADERIPEETGNAIRHLICDEGADAYSFPLKSYFHGKWIKNCGWWPDRKTRLVRKSKGHFQSITHGKWVTSGRLLQADVPMEHYSFNSYSDMIRIMNARSTDMARELFDKGLRATSMTPFIHGVVMFFKIYFIKRGILSGLDGFVIAVTRAGGTFFKYAKLLEIQRQEKAGLR